MDGPQPQWQMPNPQPPRRFNLKRIAIAALPLLVLMVIGIIVDKDEPKDADPVVGGCLATGGQQPVVADCASSEADVKILQIFSGTSADGCLTVPGATNAYIVKESLRVGGDDGVDVADTGSSVLCVGAK